MQFDDHGTPSFHIFLHLLIPVLSFPRLNHDQHNLIHLQAQLWTANLTNERTKHWVALCLLHQKTKLNVYEIKSNLVKMGFIFDPWGARLSHEKIVKKSKWHWTWTQRGSYNTTPIKWVESFLGWNSSPFILYYLTHCLHHSTLTGTSFNW